MKLAAYKDLDGTVYKFSAVCPHLKALVRYNPLEKTFDCPFHGSRFDRYGKVCIDVSTRGRLEASAVAFLGHQRSNEAQSHR